MQEDTVLRLKGEWEQAKKAADSLSTDFSRIEAARKFELEARRAYKLALEPLPS